MSTHVIDLFNRAAVGGDGANDIRLRSNGTVHVSQQFLEITSDSGNSKVRISQQFLEVTSDSGNSKIRVSQQFLEVTCTFGTPPPGKSGGATGHNKPPPAVLQWMAFRERERRARNSATGRFSNPHAVIYSVEYMPPNQAPYGRQQQHRESGARRQDAVIYSAGHLQPNPDPIRIIDVIKTVRIS